MKTPGHPFDCFCEQCRGDESAVDTQSNTEKDNNEMPKNGKKSFKKLPFLKAEHIKEQGKTAMSITRVGFIGDSGYGLKVNFDVMIGTKGYSFGVKPSNRSFRTIVNAAIEKKSVFVERGEYEGKEFVQVITPEGE